jgi:hypothetical protein
VVPLAREEGVIKSSIEVDFIGTDLELSRPAGEMSWDDAVSTEWSDGWRMPTRAELIALFHEAEEAGHIFDDKSVVWSSSQYAPDPTNAWHVYFVNGYSYAVYKAVALGIRLVRLSD